MEFAYVVHETVHLCLSVLTDKKSTLERFRFLDEGLAKLVEEEWKNNIEFENYSMRMANSYYVHEKFSFLEMQRWTIFFGIPPKADYNAYVIGSSLLFFIKREFGKEKYLNYYQ